MHHDSKAKSSITHLPVGLGVLQETEAHLIHGPLSRRWLWGLWTPNPGHCSLTNCHSTTLQLQQLLS